MTIKTTLKTSVAAAALFAVAIPTAEAGNVTNGNGNALSISGQVTKSLMYMDDGKGDRFTVADNDTSGTRFRMVGTGKINESLSVGTNIEMEYQRNGTNNVSVVNSTMGDGGTGTGQTTFVHRKGELSFKHSQFGAVTLGHGYMPSWGTGGSDLSGTTLIAIPSGQPAASGRGIRLRTSAMTGSNSSSVTVGTLIGLGHDGLGRQNRIQYNAPVFGGLALSGSVMDSGTADIAARYNAKFGGVQVKAGASYAGANTAGSGAAEESRWIMSAAIKHDSGINMNGYYGEADLVAANRNDSKSWGVRLGYSASLTSMGATNFSVMFQRSEDSNANDDKGDWITFGAVQNITDAGTAVYAGVNMYDLSRTGTTFEDVMTVEVGARVQF